MPSGRPPVMRRPKVRDKQVFISYAHSDHAWCEQFVAALEKRRIPIWVDYQQVPSSLSGDALSNALHSALSQSSVYIFLVSSDSLESAWITVEIIRQRQVAVSAAGPDHVVHAPYGIWVLIKDDLTPYQMDILEARVSTDPMLLNGEPLDEVNSYRESVRPEVYVDARGRTPEEVAKQLVPTIRRLQRTKFDVRAYDKRIVKAVEAGQKVAARTSSSRSDGPRRHWWQRWRG